MRVTPIGAASLLLVAAAPAQTSWQRLDAGPMVFPGATSVGMVYDVWRGGVLAITPEPAGRMGLWNGTQWSLQVSSSRPSSRINYAISFDIGRGRVVVFGGGQPPFGTQPFRETWEWDGFRWLLRSSGGPPARTWGAMVFDLALQRSVLFGGDLRDDTWAWDGQTWTDLQPAQHPFGRSAHCMAYDIGRNRVVLFGGSPLDDETWEFDGRNWWQRSSPTHPPRRSDAAMCYDLTLGQTLLFGGNASGQPFNDLWAWNGTSWRELIPSDGVRPEGRQLMGLAHDSLRNRTVMFGGSTGTAPSDVWEWDGSRWHRIPQGPPPVYQHGIALDSARATAVLFGGQDNAGLLRNEIWEWQSGQWTWHPTNHAPAARRDFAFCYDAARSRCVLFGGRAANTFADTWEYDGLDWIQRTPAHQPSSRSGCAMAYDSDHHVAVLVGGVQQDPQVIMSDTWTWDGNDWTLQQPPTTRSPVSNATMTYETARHRVLMVGGYTTNFAFSNACWEWDGSTWSSAPTGPTAHVGATMVYDPTRSRAVLFGGSMPANLLGDTWEFVGSTWVARSTPVGITPRMYSAAFFDPISNRMVVHGGYSVAGYQSDTWSFGLVRPATVTAFGTACPASSGTATLGSSLPWLGTNVSLTIDPVPVGAPAWVAIGFSRTNSAGAPLPRPLDALGMPGCLQLVDDLAWYRATTTSNRADLAIAIPPTTNLLHATVFAQGIVQDPAANAAGYVTTNGIECFLATP